MAFAPAVLSTIGTIANVASIGLGIYGSLAGAASERTAHEDAAKVAERNTKIAKENADATLMASQDELYDSGQETRQLVGEQTAIQAGSGLSLNSRSFIQTRAAARYLGSVDRRNIAEAAQIRAQAYRNEGDVYAADAIANRRAAGNASLKGFLGAAGSIIGGASNFVSAAPQRRTGSISVPSPVYV